MQWTSAPNIGKAPLPQRAWAIGRRSFPPLARSLRSSSKPSAGALLLDSVGLGKPLWFLCGAAMDGLLRLAHVVASAKGAVASMPSMPVWAFALMVDGGIWLCLWTTRARLLGVAPVLIGR